MTLVNNRFSNIRTVLISIELMTTADECPTNKEQGTRNKEHATNNLMERKTASPFFDLVSQCYLIQYAPFENEPIR